MAKIVLDRPPKTDEDVIVIGMGGPKPKPMYERILKRIDQSVEGCWEWPGSTTGNGYGTVSYYVDGIQKIALTHRILYEYFIGPIPEKYDIDHLCRNRICCNPAHLEPVTRMENARRGAKYRPSHCIHGHAYDEHNTIIRKTGHIRCRECERIRSMKRRGQDYS